MGTTGLSQSKKPIQHPVEILCVNGYYEIVIQDSIELDSLIRSSKKMVVANCTELFPVPSIDFEAYTLLGYSGSVSGCNLPGVESEVMIVDGVIEFRIEVIQNGLCREVFSTISWMLIPKISDDQKVEFITTHQLKE